MNSNRCEVCDDTNATIHCQECRRRTCEECDEILHLVDANKSHHRIPLFPSRGGSALNSRGGSFAPTRNVSPRGVRRQDDGPSATSWPDNAYSKAPENTYGAQAYDPPTVGEYTQPVQQPVQQVVPQRQAPPPPPQQHEYMQPQHEYMQPQQPQQNEYVQPQRAQQMQRAQPPPPPAVEQKQPTQYQPSNYMQQPAYQPQMQQSQVHQQQQYRQPPQAYGQARSGYATPSGVGVASGHRSGQRSGYATPTAYQYPVPRSMAHSGAATPTYAQPGQRYVSGGAVPYSQWAQNPITPQQQPRGASYDQKPMIDGQGQQANNPQQQAYMQHVEMIEQHKAVEAHQRLMAQRNEQMARQSQQHYPRQVSGNIAPMQPAPVHHQRYTTGYVMSNHGSMVNSVAPSARNSPPMQPMQTRLAVPGFMPQEPARQYVPVDNGYARMSWPTPVQPQMIQHQPVYGGYGGSGYGSSAYGNSGYATPAMYPVSSSMARTPYNEARTPPMYTHAINIGSVPRTPYNEPRTPYNEPLVQMQVPQMQREVPQMQREVAPRMQRASAPPPPAASAPEVQADQQYKPALQQPMHTQQYGNLQQQSQQQQQPQQHQQYGAPVHSYTSHQLAPPAVSPQRSAPRAPTNQYPQYTPLADDAKAGGGWSQRYDPDEAEARVRNLIADTERMLAGLSGLSAPNAPKPSEGVSV